MTETFYYIGLGLGASFCAYRAMISRHLLPSTLYLAGVSALVTITLYLLGAYEVAVIELKSMPRASVPAQDFFTFGMQDKLAISRLRRLYELANVSGVSNIACQIA